MWIGENIPPLAAKQALDNREKDVTMAIVNRSRLLCSVLQCMHGVVKIKERYAVFAGKGPQNTHANSAVARISSQETLINEQEKFKLDILARLPYQAQNLSDLQDVLDQCKEMDVYDDCQYKSMQSIHKAKEECLKALDVLQEMEGGDNKVAEVDILFCKMQDALSDLITSILTIDDKKTISDDLNGLIGARLEKGDTSKGAMEKGSTSKFSDTSKGAIVDTTSANDTSEPLSEYQQLRQLIEKLQKIGLNYQANVKDVKNTYILQSIPHEWTYEKHINEQIYVAAVQCKKTLHAGSEHSLGVLRRIAFERIVRDILPNEQYNVFANMLADKLQKFGDPFVHPAETTDRAIDEGYDACVDAIANIVSNEQEIQQRLCCALHMHLGNAAMYFQENSETMLDKQQLQGTPCFALQEGLPEQAKLCEYLSSQQQKCLLESVVDITKTGADTSSIAKTSSMNIEKLTQQAQLIFGPKWLENMCKVNMMEMVMDWVPVQNSEDMSKQFAHKCVLEAKYSQLLHKGGEIYQQNYDLYCAIAKARETDHEYTDWVKADNISDVLSIRYCAQMWAYLAMNTEHYIVTIGGQVEELKKKMAVFHGEETPERQQMRYAKRLQRTPPAKHKTDRSDDIDPSCDEMMVELDEPFYISELEACDDDATGDDDATTDDSDSIDGSSTTTSYGATTDDNDSIDGHSATSYGATTDDSDSIDGSSTTSDGVMIEGSDSIDGHSTTSDGATTDDSDSIDGSSTTSDGVIIDDSDSIDGSSTTSDGVIIDDSYKTAAAAIAAALPVATEAELQDEARTTARGIAYLMSCGTRNEMDVVKSILLSSSKANYDKECLVLNELENAKSIIENNREIIKGIKADNMLKTQNAREKLVRQAHVKQLHDISKSYDRCTSDDSAFREKWLLLLKDIE